MKILYYYFRQVFMQLVDKQNRLTWQSIILANIAPETEIHTDEWGAYIGLTDRYYEEISCCGNDFVIF